jgi:signal transduction histidine kinase
VTGTGRDHGDRSSLRVEAAPLITETPDGAAEGARLAPSALPDLRRALAAIRDDLGFQTASLFVPGAAGWELLDREGPVRPWHAVLDPAAFEGAPEPSAHPDVRTVPGIGGRLAGMGCASVAVLPLPDGSRLLLDSETPVSGSAWIERTRPFLSLISIMAGPVWPTGGALRSHGEVYTLERVFEACQATVAEPGSTQDEVLWRVREAMAVDELFLLTEDGEDLEVQAAPAEGWPRRLPGRASSLGPIDGASGADDALLHRLALDLASSSRALSGALGRRTPARELILAGWAEGPALSPASMTVVARAVSTAMAAIRARHRAATTLYDRERAQLAYALHDGLTQTVAGAVLELEALSGRVESDPTAAVATIDGSKAEIRRSLADLRSMLFELQRHTVDEEQPVEPLMRYVEDVMKRWRVPARISVEGDLNGVPARILAVAYVVIREGLANAAKHAGGRNVTVELLASPSDLTVTVSDRGRGFSGGDELAARQAHHFGLQMLRKRVADVGGSLSVDSRLGAGTRVIAELPYVEVTT